MENLVFLQVDMVRKT